MDARTFVIATGLVTLLGLSVDSGRLARASDDTGAEDARDFRQLENETLEILRSGSSAERLETAEGLSRTLSLGAWRQQDVSRPIDALVDGLISFLRQETDDWIARTVLDELLWEAGESMNRLFRAALTSGSVNLQAIGIQHFTTQKDPEAMGSLESLWRRSLPAWIRPRLMEALVEQGSAEYLGDFMRLTRNDDVETREAAIGALETLARPESIPVLIRLSRSGSTDDRSHALRALGAFRDSEEALDEVLRASRGDPGASLWAAVGALGRLGRPESDERLFELLDEPPAPDMRGAIAEALEHSNHPDTTRVLVRLLHQEDIATDSWISSTVLRVLRNRDDPDAIVGLLDLDGGDTAGDEDTLDLIEYLSRDRSKHDRTVTISSSCGGRARVSSEDPRAWHVSPRQPYESIRCWERPDVPGDPDPHPRIPEGSLVLIRDHFETPAESWVEVEGEGADDCWVPLADLVRGPAPSQPNASRHLRHEFDVATEALDSVRMARLAEGGLLDVFDHGDSITGAALVIDRANPEQIALLRDLVSDTDTPLDVAFHAILRLVDAVTQGTPSVDEED